MGERLRDRRDAGQRLAVLLTRYAGDDPLILGLPRGGVPVGAQIAAHLDAPLDVLVVRKLGHPRQPELALGALAEGGVRILNTGLLRRLGLDATILDQVTAREREELERRVAEYRGQRAPAAVTGRTVIVVDDGLATGMTARAAVESLRDRHAMRIILAVPVASAATATTLREVADDVVTVLEPVQMQAVNRWYDDFRQVDDDEVVRLLAERG
jgi:putative phosphoribosyl transferase